MLSLTLLPVLMLLFFSPVKHRDHLSGGRERAGVYAT